MYPPNDTVEFEDSQSAISTVVKNLGVETDFNIICGTTIFRGHRAIFATCSNYLLELFLKQPDGCFNFIVNGVQPVDVENLFTFVYQANVAIQSEQSEGFLVVANQLKIDSVVKDETQTSKALIPPTGVEKNSPALPEPISKTKIKKTELELKIPLANIRQLFGRPILSSTKLNPLNPKVPDRPELVTEQLKPILRENAFLIETMPEKEDRNIEINRTFTVHEEIIDTPQLPAYLNRKKRGRPPTKANNNLQNVRPTAGTKSRPIYSFCVAELVDKIEKKIENQRCDKKRIEIKKTATIPPQSSQGHNSAQIPKMPLCPTSNKDGNAESKSSPRNDVKNDFKFSQKRKFTKKHVKNIPSSTTTDEKNVKIRKLDTKQTSVKRTSKKILKGSDDSSFQPPQLASALRKKLPFGKRRRIPASNRPSKSNHIPNTRRSKTELLTNKKIRPLSTYEES